jgi:hypothetical protein
MKEREKGDRNNKIKFKEITKERSGRSWRNFAQMDLGKS